MSLIFNDNRVNAIKNSMRNFQFKNFMIGSFMYGTSLSIYCFLAK